VVGGITIGAADGVALEAELARPDAPVRAGVVLCHPHPQYGGSMRSIVIGALFGALPSAGVVCLRFNFRGVEASTGAFDGGRGEREDVRAAIAALHAELPPDVPLLLTGWSFGADVALSVHDAPISAWLAIAPPLRFAELGDLPTDPRPKLVALAEHDEYRPPDEVAAAVAPWSATDVVVVPGASHFFVGRTDRLVELAIAYVDRLTTPHRSGDRSPHRSGDRTGPRP
jgi:alpha/beta superfamily hydrolase